MFVTLLFPAGHCNFEMEFNAKSPGSPPIFKGSPENELYHAYFKRMDDLRETRDDCNNDWRLQQEDLSLQQLIQAEKALADYQADFVRQNAPSFAARFISQWKYATPPPPERRLQWYEEHYLDGVDIAAESFWRSPLALDWLDMFTFKMAPNPDSARWYAETVLRRLDPNPEARHYYFNYMLNSFESMSRFYFDEMFIYLVEKYVKTGKTPGYSTEAAAEKTETAEKMERLFAGKKIPEATLYTEKEEPVALYDIRAPYTLLVFFQPDCSHCKKETNLLKNLSEQFRAAGLQVVMVCGKPENRLDMCWQYRSDYTLPDDWLLLADGKSRSKYRSLFNLQSYPRMFLLDKDKTILYRRYGGVTEVELKKVLGKIGIK
jgi:peroxiredoxin